MASGFNSTKKAYVRLKPNLTNTRDKYKSIAWYGFPTRSFTISTDYNVTNHDSYQIWSLYHYQMSTDHYEKIHICCFVTKPRMLF